MFIIQSFLSGLVKGTQKQRQQEESRAKPKASCKTFKGMLQALQLSSLSNLLPCFSKNQEDVYKPFGLLDGSDSFMDLDTMLLTRFFSFNTDQKNFEPIWRGLEKQWWLPL